MRLPSSEEDVVLESLFESLDSERVLDVRDALEPFRVTFEQFGTNLDCNSGV